MLFNTKRDSFWSSCLLLTTCFSFPGSSKCDALSEAHSNRTLLWGPYRPNLYFGVRPRIPKSLLTGLIWARVDDYLTVQESFRHTCEQHQSIHGYGWDSYDVRQGGVHTVHDEGNGLDMKTTFIKIPDAGEHGGHWGFRVTGTLRPGAPEDLKTTVVFYTALEGLGHINVVGESMETMNGVTDSVDFEGETPELGKFKLVVSGDAATENKHPSHDHDSAAAQPLDRTMVRSATVPEEVIWEPRRALFSMLQERVKQYTESYSEDNLPPPFQAFTIGHGPGDGANTHLVQKVFEGPFQFDVLFSSDSAPDPLTSEMLSQKTDSMLADFKDRHAKLLKPKAPFTSDRHQQLSEFLFSNLFGGIGYFYGDSRVDRSNAPEYEELDEGFWEDEAQAKARAEITKEGPNELFTSVPSRPQFPRGFLWDEGFHLLPILDWDPDVAMEIIKSWFNLMDEDGWIAREQILGPEARVKVPQEFQVQYPHHANPPTLFYAIGALLDRLEASSATKSTADKRSHFLENPDVARRALTNLYPLLKRHYSWFRSSQRGDAKNYDRAVSSTKELYRWKGRTVPHIFTSGLDDYPRAQPPHPGELHVDAISWVGLMTKELKRIAEYLGETGDVKEFAAHESALLENLNRLHWDEERKMYCDSTIDGYEEEAMVCHKGYVSLMPFLVGLINESDKKLGPILDLIADPAELWSDHGIRSLSKNDKYYMTEENYWRSPVWINMNFLAVTQLFKLATGKGPFAEKARKIYVDLRLNLVKTVLKSWEETGFAWEQYNPDTGAGQRTQHFTGWTSLITKIMAMPDLSKGAEHIHNEL